MNTYQWNAQDYEQNSRAQQQWAREVIALLNLQGDEAILDLGCGDGKVTAEIAGLVKNGLVVGIDNSLAMINLANARYADNRHANLEFKHMDAMALSFDSCFDLVFSNAVLHWVKNHPSVLAGLYKSLRPSGKIQLRMGGKGDAEVILAAFNEVMARAKWTGYFTDFDFPYTFHGIEEYQDFLQQAGFSVVNLALIAKDMTHDGVLGLQAWIRTAWLPYTQQIPEAYHQAFIAEVAACYLEKVPLGSDGKAHIAMVMLEVEAEKC